MITSLFVYSFMVCSMFMLFRVSTVRCNGDCLLARTNNAYWYRAVSAVLIFIFFTGVRWDVGIDQFSYLKDYQYLAFSDSYVRESMELGFVGFMRLFSKLGLHFTLFFATIALVQLCCTLSFFRKERYVIPYFCIGLMCGGIFFSWCNGIRQQLVMSMFLCVSSYFLLERKLIPTLISIYLFTFFHHSAIFLFAFVPLMWVDFEKFFLKQKWQYLILFTALGLSQFSIWENLLGILDSLMSFVGYDDRYNSDVLMRVGSRTMNFGIRRTIFLLLDILIISHSKGMRIFYSSKSFGFAYAMFLVVISIQPLFMNSLAFSRFVDYFLIYRIIILSYLMFYLFNTRAYLKGIMIVLLLASHLFIQIVVDKGNHTDCIRYEFFWNRLNYDV